LCVGRGGCLCFVRLGPNSRVLLSGKIPVESMCPLGPIFSSTQKTRVSISRGVRVLGFESSSLPRGGGCAQEEKRLGWVRPQNLSSGPIPVCPSSALATRHSVGSAGRLAGFLFSGLTSPRSPPRARGGQAVSRTRAGVLLSWAPRVGFLVLRFFLCFAWSGLASFLCLVPPRRGKVDGTAEAMVGEGEVQSSAPRSGNSL